MAAGTMVAAPRAIPTIGGRKAIRVFLGFRRDPLGTFLASAASHGDVMAIDFGVRRFVLVSSPTGVEHVLVKNAKNYTKNTWGYAQMRLVLGEGLVTSQGDFWKRQRRIAQPAFHRTRIAGFVEAMGRATEDLAERWAPLAAVGGEVDVSGAMMAITLDIVGRTLLSVDVRGQESVVGDAVGEALRFLARRMRSRVALPLRWPLPSHRRFLRARAALDGVVSGILEERRRTGEDAGDLLSMFMLTRDEETGEHMTDAQLRDEVMTMFLAGHETTAMLLTWTLLLLAQHEAVAEAVREELASVLGGRTPTMEDLGQLSLLLRVLKESMRLYPPVPVIARMTEGDDTVDGFAMPAGSYILMSPWVTHRDPRWWPDPERFDPARFTPEQERARPKFAWYPFSGGQRKCIGDQFALVETQVILATLLQRYRLELAPGQQVEVEPTITVRPRGGLPMRLVKRASAS
jgi:cytochrome P450